MSTSRGRRRWLAAVCAALIGAAPPVPGDAGRGPVTHDAAFWQAIVDDDYRLPAGESALPLVDELVGLLGSPDPVLRDRYVYEIFAAWIYRDQLLPAAELERVRSRLCADARIGLGAPPDDRTLRRSFSLLDLSVLAAYDLKAPFMSQPAFDETLGVAIDSLAVERDRRGYERGKGWVHATAHVADLLKFLARNSKLTADGQRRIVGAVRDRATSAGQAFAWGEDARLAAALLSVLRRSDVDPGVLRPWLDALPAEQQQLWSGELDTAAYASVRAQVNTLTHLAAMLGREPDDRLDGWKREIQATLARTAL